jgi:hypothetical protein
LYDSTSDKCCPLRPSTEANKLVILWPANDFACTLEVDNQTENSIELWPNLKATLENEEPKFEPNSVRRVHPVVGTFVTRADDTDGWGVDTLKPLELRWTPTVAATAYILVLPQDFTPIEDVDVQAVDSDELRPNREDTDASNAENPNPVKKSLIEPESAENLEMFRCASYACSNASLSKVQAWDIEFRGREVTDAANERRPATPEAVRQSIWEDDNQIVDSHAENPRTRVGLAEFPNKAPRTETISEADYAPLAIKTPETVPGCMARLKSEVATL